MKTSTWFSLTFLFAIVSFSAFAQEDLRFAGLTYSRNNSIVTIGDYTINNLWLSSKNAETKRVFMHGAADAKARPLPWTVLLPEEADQARYFAPDVKLDSPAKSATLPVLKLEDEGSLFFAEPVLTLSQLAELKGQTVRIYLWLKGEKCGTDLPLWEGAPAANLTLRDSFNNAIAESPSLFKTRGTFPWFCYHVDIAIPANLNTDAQKEAKAEKSAASLDDGEKIVISAADSEKSATGLFADFNEGVTKQGGLYLTLKNNGCGTACFTALSWEVLKPGAEAKQYVDAKTGSTAPNPDFDEFPMQVFFGLADSADWNFLNGNASTPNLTTLAGLEAYLTNARNDWFHAQNGIPFLAAICRQAQASEQSITFEDGWMDALKTQLLAMQDSKTGLWTVNGIPSITVTDAIIRNNFVTKTVKRPDCQQSAVAFSAFEDTPLPNAELLAASLLDARLNKEGRKTCWNRFAFQTAAADGDLANTADLGSTAAAASVLRAVYEQTDNADLKHTISRALNAARRYVMLNLVQENGLWLLNEKDGAPTQAAFLPQFLEATQWLESQPWENAPSINAEISFGVKGDLQLTWVRKEDSQRSLRLYAVPADIDIKDINDTYLVGIINRNNARIHAVDPIAAAIRIQNAAEMFFGTTFRQAGAPYLAWKADSLRNRLTVANTGSKLKIARGSLNALAKSLATGDASSVYLNFYVAAVNELGQRTELAMLTDRTFEL